MASGKPRQLQLEASAHGLGATWRKNAHMIDALPYIDMLPEQEKKKVDALIEEECRRGVKRPSDYLAELPPIPNPKFEDHPVLQTELERVRAKQAMAPLDTSRFRLEPPPLTKRNDLHAWKSALDNAHAQLEHQYTRIQNLELLLKHGDKSWRAQTLLEQATLRSLEAELTATRKAVTSLNQERKLSQTAAGSELHRISSEYASLVARNLEIELACEQLENEVLELKARAEGENNTATTNTTTTSTTNTITTTVPSQQQLHASEDVNGVAGDGNAVHMNGEGVLPDGPTEEGMDQAPAAS